MALGKLQNESDLLRWMQQNFPQLNQAPGTGTRILRGIIDSTGSGSITWGSGFSITRNGTGDVTITFDAEFNRPPAVIASRIGAGVANLTGTPDVASARVIIRDTGFTVADGTFEFIAVENDA